MKEKILSVMAKYDDKKINVEQLCVELHNLKHENQNEFFLAVSYLEVVTAMNELLHRDNELLENYIASQEWRTKRDSL